MQEEEPSSASKTVKIAHQQTFGLYYLVFELLLSNRYCLGIELLLSNCYCLDIELLLSRH